ncbi:MAG TPA: DUF2784 domain-containing protein [Myxococcaceae bacterium]|nr:DUF2784 domain-containing protein [Myxococcaceae bacterium]
MLFRLAAGAVVLVHLGFIAMVVLGGLLVLRWPRAAWVQLPVFGWGAAVNLAGWPCPLTTWENALRARGGLDTYPGAFVTHYLLPSGGWRVGGVGVETAVGLFVLLANAVVYGLVVWRRRHGTEKLPG